MPDLHTQGNDVVRLQARLCGVNADIYSALYTVNVVKPPMSRPLLCKTNWEAIGQKNDEFRGSAEPSEFDLCHVIPSQNARSQQLARLAARQGGVSSMKPTFKRLGSPICRPIAVSAITL